MWKHLRAGSGILGHILWKNQTPGLMELGYVSIVRNIQSRQATPCRAFSRVLSYLCHLSRSVSRFHLWTKDDVYTMRNKAPSKARTGGSLPARTVSCYAAHNSVQQGLSIMKTSPPQPIRASNLYVVLVIRSLMQVKVQNAVHIENKRRVRCVAGQVQQR